MCGLVGVISNFNNGLFIKQVQTFEQLLQVDVLRGDDATGIAAITTKQGATVLKEAIAGTWFIYDKEYDALAKDFTKETKALLGHNRKATVGGRKDENAHPFVFDDRYVFFHNGTLHNHKAIKNTEVDSEALGSIITPCNGDVDKIATALAPVLGAWCMVWYDSVKHHIYFLKNKERPLTILQLEDHSIVYASEHWMAYGVSQRNGLSKVKTTLSCVEDVLYSVDLNVMPLVIKEEPLPKKARPTEVMPRGHTTASTTAVITKKEARKLANRLSQTKRCFFFPDDVISRSGAPFESMNQYDVADYLVMGTNETWEGAVFKVVVKDLFPYEAEELLDGRIISVQPYEHEYRGGNLEVWCCDPQMSSKKVLTH